MIQAIEKGILAAGSIGSMWGIMLIEQDPRAGFAVSIACLSVMIAVILLDMKMPRRSGHSKRGRGDYHHRHHTIRR